MLASVEMSLPVAVLEISGAFIFSFFTRYCQQCPSAVVAVLYLLVCSLHWQVISQLSLRVWAASRRTASTDPANMDYSVIKAEHTKSAPGSFHSFHPCRFSASLLAQNWCIYHHFTPGLAVASMHNPMSARFHHTCYPFFHPMLPSILQLRKGEERGNILSSAPFPPVEVLEALCSRPTQTD